MGTFLIFILAYLISCANTSKSKDCPDICICLGLYVDCASNKLESVPINLPKWATHLDLHNNAIKKLNDVVWKNLTTLTELNLNKNEISVISNNAFNYQKQLKILEINRNQLRYIDALTFKPLKQLTILKLKRNQIIQLKDGAFYSLLSLDKLILDYNYIQVISKGWLYGLGTLKFLSLNHNNINRIDTDAWEFCQGLNYLDLSYNELKFITLDTFKNLGLLQKLLLNNNNITFIEENAFNHLPNLRILNLNYNKISWAIEDANGVFQGLGNLIKFFLVGNNIKSINKNAFVGLKTLTHLNLTNNNITSVQKNAFIETPSLLNLNINTTCLLCDCNLHWFRDWLITKDFKIRAECAYPDYLKGQSLIKVNNFTCDELPKPRLIEQPEPEIMALKGENISLSCTAMSSAASEMIFHWKKDNVELPNDNIVTITNAENGKTTETISKFNLFNVQHSNAGKYQCVVSNNFGSTYSQKSSISVLIFPTFIKIPANVTVQAGETAKLECAVHGEPQPEIAWQKDGGNDFPAARERRMHVMPTDDAFFITRIKPSDMGIYSCTAHNAAGTIVANASLTVQEKPSFVKPMENKEVTSGELIVLECMASGIPKPVITWLKDNGAIKTTERHFFTAEDQLMIIVDTVTDDSGIYQCHLNNSLGEVTGYSHLKVKQSQSVTNDVLGIVIITVVCCAVLTSIVWVVIIYQTRRKMSNQANQEAEVPPLDFTEVTLARFDNISDNSSCKDSGTGDCAKRSSDNLAPEEFTLTINASQSQCKVMRTASLVYLTSDCDNYHTVLLHSDGICTCLRRGDGNGQVTEQPIVQSPSETVDE